ncbi:hypothetical protein CYMTET_37593 [Cymbomonas tetramitiformis]|uniref:Uncharacterized protein n=1 Tax=Cymbomonas tetramitiformis TaxID=36881 RepID=A0AAE0CDQ7_9CHLO|nr:hypothetical protein CYMTET_37593 [Cymbomonas tetramitiformis]
MADFATEATLAQHPEYYVEPQPEHAYTLRRHKVQEDFWEKLKVDPDFVRRSIDSWTIDSLTLHRDMQALLARVDAQDQNVAMLEGQVQQAKFYTVGFYLLVLPWLAYVSWRLR